MIEERDGDIFKQQDLDVIAHHELLNEKLGIAGEFGLSRRFKTDNVFNNIRRLQE